MPINTLICTTGTSLFHSNLSRLDKAVGGDPANREAIYNHYSKGNWSELVKELLKLDPSDRLLGAEINTIEASRSKKWLDPERIIFLVSDTEAGRNTGRVLEGYFNSRRDLDLKAEYRVIESLQDQSPAEFKKFGLRNLVKEIGSVVGRFGSQNVAIDATGGYKAQIAIAVMMGQALNIPVYYKHEFFSEIIDFPPMPVTLDYDLLGRYADLFTDLERGEAVEAADWGEIDARLKVFVTEVEVEGETLLELNAVGQLYLTAFRLRYPKAPNVKPLADEERKEPTFRDDHYPDGFKSFVNKVWNENRWIKTCWSMSFHGQKRLVGTSFSVRKSDENKFFLEGIFEDRNNFGAPFHLELCDNSVESLNWAADQLNMQYRK